MILYHGTNQEAWEHIQSDGYLNNFTYFTRDIEVAKEYGNIILKTDFDIVKNRDYVIKLAWYEYLIFKKIPLKNIKRII